MKETTTVIEDCPHCEKRIPVAFLKPGCFSLICNECHQPIEIVISENFSVQLKMGEADEPSEAPVEKKSEAISLLSDSGIRRETLSLIAARTGQVPPGLGVAKTGVEDLLADVLHSPPLQGNSLNLNASSHGNKPASNVALKVGSSASLFITLALATAAVLAVSVYTLSGDTPPVNVVTLEEVVNDEITDTPNIPPDERLEQYGLSQHKKTLASPSHSVKGGEESSFLADGGVGSSDVASTGTREVGLESDGTDRALRKVEAAQVGVSGIESERSNESYLFSNFNRWEGMVDGKESTFDNTWTPKGTVGDLGFIGVRFNEPQNGVAAIEWDIQVFVDGGWFNGAEGCEPIVQYTTVETISWRQQMTLSDKKMIWKTVEKQNDDYPDGVNADNMLEADAAGVKVGSTFRFTFSPVDKVTGIRIIGDQGGKPRGAVGYIAVNELRVFKIP